MSYCFKFFWLMRGAVYKLIFNDVGNLTYLGRPLFIHNANNIVLGNKVGIFPGARFESHEGGRIVIRDNVSIGQSFHITSMKNDLIIDEGTIISANVCVTNIDHQYEDISQSVRNQPLCESSTYIGENCFIGYGVVIQAGTVLGKHCVVGANSTIKGTFPDYSVIVGSPGKVVKIYDKTNDVWVRVDS